MDVISQGAGRDGQRLLFDLRRMEMIFSSRAKAPLGYPSKRCQNRTLGLEREVPEVGPGSCLAGSLSEWELPSPKAEIDPGHPGVAPPAPATFGRTILVQSD